MHIPRSEDVPVVQTPGVQLRFYLQPYNFFDQDPSLTSQDDVYHKPCNNEMGDASYGDGVCSDKSSTDLLAGSYLGYLLICGSIIIAAQI